ncbi:MAG: nuclear transport factor 2 family protein [Candidatus Methanoperedens sp.]|nr:nuclear transport factor 2 family protein [Candidatus Methanoperedens sp.]
MNEKSVTEDIGKTFYEMDKILAEWVSTFKHTTELIKNVAHIPFENLSAITGGHCALVHFLKKDETAPLINWVECKMETITEMKPYISQDKQKEIEIQLGVYESMLKQLKKKTDIQNQTAVPKFYELYNAKDIDGIMALFSPDGEISFFIFPTARGLDEIRAFLEIHFRAFPDAKMTMLKLLSEGTAAIAIWTWTGTNSGPIDMPDGKIIPPTGRTFTVQGVTVYDFKGDRIMKVRLYFQEISFLKQLGLQPFLCSL